MTFKRCQETCHLLCDEDSNILIWKKFCHYKIEKNDSMDIVEKEMELIAYNNEFMHYLMLY